MTTFTSYDEDRGVVIGIAETLFDELQGFGQLATAKFALIGDVPLYNQRRAMPILGLLRFLEDDVGLTFVDAPPHSYAVGAWPSDIPIAERGGPTACAMPSDCVRAMIDHWDASAHGLSTYLRLLRSALYVLESDDLQAAVDYLLDLHATGAAPIEETVERVIVELLLAHSHCGSAQATVSFLLGEPPPKDPTGWERTLSSLPDIGIEYRIDTLDAASKATLSSVLERAAAQVERVRADAADYDEWFLGQQVTCGLIAIVGGLYEHGLFGEKPPPIAVRAALSGLEEISADGTGRLGNALLRTIPPADRTEFASAREQLLALSPPELRSFSERLIPPRYDSELSFARQAVGTSYRAAYGDAWADELFWQRLLVPAALGPGVLLDENLVLPPPWQSLTWRLAHPYTALCQPSLHPAQVRSVAFDAPDLLGANHDFAIGLRARGVSDDLAEDVVDSVLNLLEAGFEFGGPSNHPDYPQDLADRLAVLDQLAEYPIETNELLEAVRQAHRNTSADEILAALPAVDTLVAAGHFEVGMRATETLLGLYPWNDDLLFLRARAAAGAGRWADALAAAVAAVALEPVRAERWDHLGIVCDALDLPDDASLSRRLATAAHYW